MNADWLTHLNTAAQVLFDKKGVNIFAVDVSSTARWAESCLVAEGTVARHVVALADAVEETLRVQGITPFYSEGRSEGDWVVLDYGEMVVHLMLPELRDKYRLEELWKEGEVVDLAIETGGEK